MLLSMAAWILRFALFSYGNPADGLWMIILSCIVYGMAFDFFNISGSLFVETSTNSKIRSSAQGIFMMMTNGVGAILGSLTSGWLIDKFFTLSFSDAQKLADYLLTDIHNSKFLAFVSSKGSSIQNGLLENPILLKDWPDIWLAFAMYVSVITVLFMLLFHHKHDPEAINKKLN